MHLVSSHLVQATYEINPTIGLDLKAKEVKSTMTQQKNFLKWLSNPKNFGLSTNSKNVRNIIKMQMALK